MIVSAIAAMDRSGLIGNGLRMPWHLPRDLGRFRRHTLGKPVIMGRRTFESLRSPLDRRLNIVLTHNPSLRDEGFKVARSIEEALKLAGDHLALVGGQEAMIIGGGIVFEATCRLWDRLLLTVVEGEFRGDTYFPLDRVKGIRWRTSDPEFCPADDKNPHAHCFLTLERLGTDVTDRQGFDLPSWLKGQPGPIQGLPLSPC
jgi:dihydrofolate reductase